MVIVSVLRDRGLRDKRELFYSPFVILFLSSAYQDARKCVVIKVLMLNSHACEQCGCSSAFDLASICPLRSSTALVGCAFMFFADSKKKFTSAAMTTDKTVKYSFCYFSLFFTWSLFSANKNVCSKKLLLILKDDFTEAVDFFTENRHKI
jgi:hypothetical protein